MRRSIPTARKNHCRRLRRIESNTKSAIQTEREKENRAPGSLHPVKRSRAMSLGTVARLRDVATLAIDEFHLKIMAAHTPEAVSDFANSSTHLRIPQGVISPFL
jgi:hypothetical protein